MWSLKIFVKLWRHQYIFCLLFGCCLTEVKRENTSEKILLEAAQFGEFWESMMSQQSQGEARLPGLDTAHFEHGSSTSPDLGTDNLLTDSSKRLFWRQNFESHRSFCYLLGYKYHFIKIEIACQITVCFFKFRKVFVPQIQPSGRGIILVRQHNWNCYRKFMYFSPALRTLLSEHFFVLL